MQSRHSHMMKGCCNPTWSKSIYGCHFSSSICSLCTCFPGPHCWRKGSLTTGDSSGRRPFYSPTSLTPQAQLDPPSCSGQVIPWVLPWGSQSGRIYNQRVLEKPWAESQGRHRGFQTCVGLVFAQQAQSFYLHPLLTWWVKILEWAETKPWLPVGNPSFYPFNRVNATGNAHLMVTKGNVNTRSEINTEAYLISLCFTDTLKTPELKICGNPTLSKSIYGCHFSSSICSLCTCFTLWSFSQYFKLFHY